MVGMHRLVRTLTDKMPACTIDLTIAQCYAFVIFMSEPLYGHVQCQLRIRTDHRIAARSRRRIACPSCCGEMGFT